MSPILICLAAILCVAPLQENETAPRIARLPVDAVYDYGANYDYGPHKYGGSNHFASAHSAPTTPIFSHRPQGSIVVSADANAVFKNAFAQSWNRVNDQLGKRQIQARNFSKVDYQIRPIPSFDGALIKLIMDGSSFGESTASSSADKKLILDTLTKFRSRQLLLLRSSGIEYGPPDIKVKAVQSFNRTSATGPLVSSLMKRIVSDPPAGFEARTKDFARKQILQNVNCHLQKTFQEGINTIHRLFAHVPTLQSYQWTLSSDDQFIYASADSFYISDEVTLTNQPQRSSPLTVTLDNAFATRLVNDHLSNKIFGSRGVQDHYTNVSKFVQLPKWENKSEQNWNIEFGSLPAIVTFLENQINFKIETDRISSETQAIKNMIIEFAYRPIFKNGFWYLIRDQQVSVHEAGDRQGEPLGARQLGFRTVMSKRLDRVIPKYLGIKKFNRKAPQQASLDMDLELDKMQSSPGFMTLGFQTK